MTLSSPPHSSSAFTRADLLGASTALGLFGLLVLGTGSATRNATQSTVCSNNSARSIRAWLMHAQDNRALLGNSYEWGRGNMNWLTQSDNTNRANVLPPSFAPYIGNDPDVFRCPSDRFVSEAQQALGWRNRVRTYSMNGQVGVQEPTTFWGGNFPTYRKLADFTDPSGTFVFIEEHPGSINDSLFGADPTGAQVPSKGRIIDIPAGLHGQGAQVSFADGHSELHRWVGSHAVQPVQPGVYVDLIVSAPNDPDAIWLGLHASQRR